MPPPPAPLARRRLGRRAGTDPGRRLGDRPWHPFPGWAALLPVAGAVAVIAAGPGAWANRRLLSSRPAVFIGLISYPLYLWHWPLLSYATILRLGRAPTPLLAAALLLAALLLAWLTWRLVEKPLRFGTGAPRKALALLALVAAVGLTGGAARWAEGFPARFPDLPGSASSASTSPSATASSAPRPACAPPPRGR
ncbi:hypothetical protein ACFQU7_17920 [Pseudoroseomonas wenyumeiae]